MKSFKNFVRQDNMAITMKEALETMQDLKSKLIELGYIELKDKGSKKVIVVTSEPRTDAMAKIQNALAGAKFNPDMSGSSIGGIELPSGLGILIKSTKGGGSGAGAAMTALVESAQCLYCAARWYENGKYDADSLKRAYKHVDVTEPLDKMINDPPEDWIKSFIVTAEKLYEKYSSVKNYKFHRGSSWVERLENRFKAANKVEKEFSNINKWTPADIWMVSNSSNENFSGADSLIQLNSLLLKGIFDKQFIGVSLKKTSAAKFSEQNITKDRSTYEIKNPWYTTGRRNFFSAKDIYLMYHDGEVQFRTFAVGSSWQGEIKGKYANHGKISYGPVNSIVKRLSGKSLDDPNALKTMFSKNRDGLNKKFYEYYKDIETRPLSYDKFVGEISRKEWDWHLSKYLGAQLISLVGKKDAEKVIGAAISYASSNSEMSAPFIKIS